MINAGELKNKITLQQQAKDQDGHTRPENPWEDVATVWAAMITTGGKEFFAAQKINAETNAVFKIRYKPNIDAAMRICFSTRKFNILHVNNVDARNIELQLSCSEVV